MSAVTTGPPAEVATRAEPRPAPRSSRLVRSLTSGPAALLLVVVALLWLVPTVGLLVSSFRTAASNAEGGWWTASGGPRLSSRCSPIATS